MKVYAIIPARAGSKGVPNKNIRPLLGHPLMAYSIEFAKGLGCDKVLCSTNSEVYADIARLYGAEVPFLRSEHAASDSAMEHDILHDLNDKFSEFDIPHPDIIVWLRPTFIFREKRLVRKGIDLLIKDETWTAARTVCQTEGRIYRINKSGQLTSGFEDLGKSMIRRQDIGEHFKVYSTDIFRFDKNRIGEDFLGSRVFGMPTNKICGLDIDDEQDFEIVESLVRGSNGRYEPFLSINPVFES